MSKLLANCYSQAIISSICRIPRGPLHSPNFTYNTCINCISSKVSSSVKIGTYPVRKISTSQTRHINPVVVFLFRPVGRILFLILGKLGKRSWQKLPLEKKQAFFNHFKSNKYSYAGFCAYVTGGLLVAYEKNVSYCPITSKRKFKLFSDSEIQKHDAEAYQIEYENEFKNKIMSPYSRQCYRVQRVGKRLLERNEVLRKYNWKVLLVNDNSVENAFAMSDGHLVVYTGLFNLCQSDDDLATVLSHEMAHVVLEHGNLKLSRHFLIEFFLWPLIFFTWLMGPGDILSILLTYLYSASTELSFVLPYSREMELEADFLGLLLLTNACYDVRKSADFWITVHEHEEIMRKDGNTVQTERETDKEALSGAIRSQFSKWSSTHPSPLCRHQHLKKCTDQAIRLRSSCGCPPLDSKSLQTEQNPSYRKTIGQIFKSWFMPINS